MSLRDSMNQRPWIGYVIVGLLIAAGAFAFFRFGSGGADDISRLSQKITIRDAQTGDEWTVLRADMELGLIQQSNRGVLDPSRGLVNEKTGKPNGFPVDGSWASTVERINQERAAANQSRQSGTRDASTR